MAMRYLRPPLPVYLWASASMPLAVHPCRIASPSVKRSWSDQHTERRNSNSFRLPAAMGAVMSRRFQISGGGMCADALAARCFRKWRAKKSP